MKLRAILASLATICMLTSCEDIFDDGSLQPDGSKPSLTINNPTNNQSISTTQGLRVKVTVVDKDKIKDLQFKIKGAGSESNLVSFKKMPDRSVFEFDSTIVMNGIAPGEYMLLVEATDKRTNIEHQEIRFNVR